jgi:hypothetical protein
MSGSARLAAARRGNAYGSVASRDLVVHALRHPGDLSGLTLSQWDVLVRQARQADVLARIAAQIESRGQWHVVPVAPRAHLEAARRVAAAQSAEVRREIAHLLPVLAPLGFPVLLLKGAAYLAAQLPCATGRVFTDTDILVPKARLAEAESALMMNGWMSTHHSAYDQRYYRQWMHELPPLEHLQRRTVLDVHHTILPETARLKPDAGKLIAAALPVAGTDGVSVLAPVDMVLHSMTHLLHNDELSHGLRDLSDLDLLLRHFSAAAGFWSELVERARELDLARPLHYALQSAHHILDTPVPQHTLAEAARAAPRWPLAALMEALWCRALRSQHPTAAPPLTGGALFLLYVRAHWMRMPPLLLARHLSIKAWRRARPEPSVKR